MVGSRIVSMFRTYLFTCPQGRQAFTICLIRLDMSFSIVQREGLPKSFASELSTDGQSINLLHPVCEQVLGGNERNALHGTAQLLLPKHPGLV